MVDGSLDCFLKLDSFGADLVARTFGGLIGKSADHNFRETAGFIAQVSKASRDNPAAMSDVARRLPQVEDDRKQQFTKIISLVAAKAAEASRTANRDRPVVSR